MKIRKRVTRKSLQSLEETQTGITKVSSLIELWSVTNVIRIFSLAVLIDDSANKFIG